MSTNKYLGYGKALDTKALQSYLCVGKMTAMQIGEEAKAVIHVGRKAIYNRDKIDEYIDRITGEKIELLATEKNMQYMIRKLEDELQ